MPQCANLPDCPFFGGHPDEASAMAEMYRRKYCLGSNTACARFRVQRRLGPGGVPGDLAPNDHDRAQAMSGEADAGKSGGGG